MLYPDLLLNPIVGVAIFIKQNEDYRGSSVRFSEARLSTMFDFHVLKAMGLEVMSSENPGGKLKKISELTIDVILMANLSVFKVHEFVPEKYWIACEWSGGHCIFSP